MAAATHMVVGSADSSASISPPPHPWHPVVIAPNHQHHALYDDLDLTPSPSPSPFPTTLASPARHNHHEHHLRRPASRRRRPRPSRKLPTTYIRADAASFRRMVHQVTAADDVAAAHQDQTATVVELLCRPAPPPLSRAAALTTTTTTTIPPTLDTSALLFGGAPGGAGGATPARPAGASCRRHCSTVPAVVGDAGAALQVKAEEACGRCGVRGVGYSCSYSNDDGGSAGGGFESLDDKAYLPRVE